MSCTLVTEPGARTDEEIANSMSLLGGECPLLSLPLEIRLQIYGWVHAMHPVQHAQLAPWYPTPRQSVYFLRLVKPEVIAEDLAVKEISSKVKSGEDGKAGPKQEELLLSPYRPLSGIPAALMCTNKQIYNECRALPLQVNEFVFVNWFSSGLWAARAFMRGLEPWQRDMMRFTRLEMLGRDFTGPALKEWIELCGHWGSGLRGLRLKILIGGGIFEPTATFAALNNNAEAQAMGLNSKTVRPEPRPEWIEGGLKRMKALRRLEIELSVLDWGADEKIAWCAELERMLNDGRWEEGQAMVVVSCVERLMQDSGPKRQVVSDFAKN
ncbi:uncharacterized protein ColSpa_01907 [Colletotrichum spaethianum]|uniref:Uncharacterized protein n=1 Tax=Colletotrichum spaethianum TaxID=700344 RepID=A0AA37L4A5_9PEZI|nr:uncharacterized protein ColSpa_01907 [Colletotrichum spaethianum]GKT41726.1 hypothetical protein ColSpa_01907 [Colletotrichum spaethianum]